MRDLEQRKPAYMADMTFKLEPAKRKLQKILDEMKGKTFVRDDLVDIIHVSRRSTTMYVNYLHQVLREIHIARWEYRGEKKKHPTAVYAVGKGRDAVKPPPKTSAEKSRIRKQALIEKLGGVQELRAKRRAEYKRVPKPDLAASWIRPLTEEERKEYAQTD